ncbi:hypothetical protein [Streptomyces canus]|uniref:hypothetical protein n=1 Tax=Streptomyces canus TaxID=58343 RepID=UPI000ABCFE5B|nr:hypothetical protein [Streptomyces canus]
MRSRAKRSHPRGVRIGGATGFPDPGAVAASLEQPGALVVREERLWHGSTPQLQETS